MKNSLRVGLKRMYILFQRIGVAGGFGKYVGQELDSLSQLLKSKKDFF